MNQSGPVSVYVLRSLKDGKRYVGLSAVVDDRLDQHNKGKVKSTKSRRPFVLVHEDVCGGLVEARKLERYFKTSAGRKFLDKNGW
jgi:putative endonuclease